MPRPFLLGPTSIAFADEYLPGFRATGQCKTFGLGNDVDLEVSTTDSWSDISSRFPSVWQPEFIAVWLENAIIPDGLWDAPIPIIALAAGWDSRWHAYRRAAERCDVILVDQRGRTAFHDAGYMHARSAILSGLGQSFLEHTWPSVEAERDIDVLFVGSLPGATRRDRLSWLGRLGMLADRHRIVIRSGVEEAEYRNLLGRSKIVFNRSEHGTCDRQAFEAVGADTLLLQERGNKELSQVLRPGEEFAEYGDSDLEEVLKRFLAHDQERITIAAAAKSHVHEFAFEKLFARSIESLDNQWDDLRQRALNRKPAPPKDRLRLRTALALNSPHPRDDETLLFDLIRADEESPKVAEWPAARASIAAAMGVAPPALIDPLRRAVSCKPSSIAAAFSLPEAFAAIGNGEEFVHSASQALTIIDQADSILDDPTFIPLGPHLVRIEWERAAWLHAGDRIGEAQAKRALARWHVHSLLATVTGHPDHFKAAVASRPDLPSGQAALGCALARAGRLKDAITHLQVAIEADPFDRSAAKAMAQALADTGEAAKLRRFARSRQALAKAAPEAAPPEAWFANTPPVGDELATIIVLCCNELEITRLCLESVIRHTRSPYELILIDNGSTDGTPAYLDSLRQREGPDRVVVIQNEQNRGYPVGVNQGLEAARGEYLVTLNNDVVVTSGWLNRLIMCSLHDWPRVGLVGAVTNYAPPPQRVEPGYTDLSELDSFATRHAAQFAGQAIDSPRLTGFCLLVRRAAFETIGKLDERFGLGFFDDDDLCLRARRAGFRLAVAFDCYVHHFGSRTFNSLGIDTGKQLDANLELYRAKWGNEEASRYKPIPAERPRRTAGTRPRVSLTMIVKNEEKHLPDCLRSVQDLVDEIIVVDTGSTDRTKEVAQSFGAKVFDFTWVDSFSAARNAALERATGDWVFWMDADDRLDEVNRERARALFDSLNDDNAAYAMKCYCLGEVAGTATTVDHVRLFRNWPGIRWKYRIHEQILPGVRAMKGDVRWADVVVTHVGYADPSARQRKVERDLRLLTLEYDEQPEDPFTLFNLGSVYNEIGRPADAVSYLERSLNLSHPRDSIVRKLYALIANCRRQLGQQQEALAACALGREHYPDDEELLFVESIIRRERRDFAGAEACLRRLLEGGEGDHFASVSEGLRGHKARHHLANLYLDTARPKEAESEWRKVLLERPDFLPARSGLGEVFLAGRRWDELEAHAVELESFGPVGNEAAEALRGRGKLERKEYASARWALSRAARRFPDSISLRLLWSQAALSEGQDREGEAALVEVLALAPWQPEARFNLAVVKARRHLKPDEELSLTTLYRIACAIPSDIHEHLPTLYNLARQCGHVTEFGTRTGVSTTALLSAQPARMICYDRVKQPEVDLLERLANRTTFSFRLADVRRLEIEPTDLLFIDTLHDYDQLRSELAIHSGKVRRWIVLHDTTTFAESGETPGQPGLWSAVEEFLSGGQFRLMRRDENNNGLTVLERVVPLM